MLNENQGDIPLAPEEPTDNDKFPRYPVVNRVDSKEYVSVGEGCSITISGNGSKIGKDRYATINFYANKLLEQGFNVMIIDFHILNI